MTTEVVGWEDVERDDHLSDEKYISEETRYEVYRRDNYRCRKCGDEDFDGLTLHHVIYRSQGGGHHAENLICLCWTCHRKIHDGKLKLVRYRGEWFFNEVGHWRKKRRQGTVYRRL